MNKISYLLLFGLLTSAFVGNCQKNDFQKQNLKGKIHFISEKTYQTLDEGIALKKGRMVQWYRNEFNLHGNKVEDTKYKSDSTIDKKYVYTLQ